jgi:hypothetical protein
VIDTSTLCVVRRIRAGASPWGLGTVRVRAGALDTQGATP